MELSRLPNSQTDLPFLLGSFDFDTRKVGWTLDDEIVGRDETVWFQVWKRNDAIHVSATQWYHQRGEFHLVITDVSPDQAVALAERVSFNANDMIDGGAGLETIT